MSTTNQNWFFEKTSDVLFVDEDNEAVGILNSNPSYTLDVNGTINTSNLLTINTITDYIEGSNAIISTIEGDNAMIDFINCVRLHATSNVSASNLISQSNLKLLNTWISDECPKPNNGSLFGFALGGGFIDPSWLKVDNDWGQFLDSAWNALQSGYDLFQLVRSIFDEEGKLADELKEALDDAFDEGLLKVPWGSVKQKPIFVGELTKNVAIAGELYLSQSKNIYSVNENNYSSANPDGNLDLTTSAGRIKILDVGSNEAWLKLIHSSNIDTSNLLVNDVIVTSNLQSPSINANEIISASVKVDNQLRVGDFYVRDDGIYRGDPSFPLTSQLVIDAQGNYKGTIPKSQITDLEGFSLNALTDGTLAWAGYGNENNALNDPFAQISTPLFNI